MDRNYDVFISYRRESGEKDARIIKLALFNKGYNAFYDYDELIDGKFDHRIVDAIKRSSVFLLLLTEGALDRCADESDWVRQEIELADKYSCYIVPVIIDESFKSFPENLPQGLKSLFDRHQFSDIYTKALFNESFNKIVVNRIDPQIDRYSEENMRAEIHVSANADCLLMRFGKKYRYIAIGEDHIIRLKHGDYKLEFVSVDNKTCKIEKVINIPNDDYTGYIDVKMKEEIEKKKEKEEKQDISETEPLIPLWNNGKYGFKTEYTGEEVIPCIWSGAKDFSEGLASVKNKKNKWGFVDYKGVLVIPCKWKDTLLFNGDLAAVKGDNDKWGFVDKKGNLAIPCKWKEAKNFSEELAAVKDENNKWGFVDKNGNLAIPCEWTEVENFCEGLARVSTFHRIKYIDHSGKSVNDLSNSYFLSRLDKQQVTKQDIKAKQGIMCKTSDERKCIRFVQNDKFGFKDSQTGEVVIPCKWIFAGGFHEGLAFVKDDNGKHGFINKTGEEVIPCKWFGASDFCEGLAAVKGDNGKYGFIDKMGEVTISCKWEGAWDFCENLARVKDDDGKYGFIDKTGELAIPCKWEFAENFREGLARIKGGGKHGFIDKTGKIVRSY